MQHRGEIVEQAVRSSGYSISKLAAKMGKSRRWMYLMFDNPNLSLDHILKIGRLINYDFSADIQEFKNFGDTTQDSVGYFRKDDKSVLYWREKYYELLEEYHQLLKNIKI